MSALLLLAQMAKPTGKIIGGWEYVWAAYIVTWVGLAAYGLSLWVRRRAKKES